MARPAMTERQRGTLVGLARNPAAPGDVLLRLLALGDVHGITGVVVRREELPQDVVDAIVTHPDRRVRELYGLSATADPEQRARLLDGPPGDAMVLAHGPLTYRTAAPPLPTGRTNGCSATPGTTSGTSWCGTAVCPRTFW
ncbi:hypothetical protein [Streptomyces sp. V1I6]|uniref:hypothetical protein n=1 Tax=Streptomyces sp. V1I6 TaxID=3042273 RepID=UPI0027873D34|nr:hypothetical protein [Streptomyces sp. V1I6]MDQ0842307.1 hypothetical protein [Streptomyces sp. V1I6]